MKTLDIRFNDQMMTMLKSMVGKKLLRYKCDPFVYSPTVYGIVGVCTDSGSYAFVNTTEVMDYYGSDEDVAVFRLEEKPEEQIVSLVQNMKIVDVPINRSIREIKLVNEHQMLYLNEEPTYDVWLTRGIVFIMDDGLEISFEKNVWFSEMITVNRGEHLIDTFAPTGNFSDDWEKPYKGKCEREILSIS